MANLHRQKSNFLKKDILPLTTKICVNRNENMREPADQSIRLYCCSSRRSIINEAPKVSVIMKDQMQELS